MTDEDYGKLGAFVSGGGTLLTGIPQFSTHTGREFLKEMDDLALYRDGDLSELCGIFVKGRGEAFSGQWISPDYGEIPAVSLSAMPSDSPDEDGTPYLADVVLCGAEVVARDAVTGKPMLVRRRFGKGYVYTLTLWAYPGHERFQAFSAAWVRELAEKSRGDVYVEDGSGEVFWTVWKDGEDVIVMLLNTDWTAAGNEKNVVLHSGTETYPLAVREQSAAIVTIGKCGPEVAEYRL